MGERQIGGRDMKNKTIYFRPKVQEWYCACGNELKTDEEKELGVCGDCK